MKWVSIATAPSQLVAEMWCNLLVSEDVPAIVRAGDVSTFLGLSPHPCRVMVPHGREEEARALLAAEAAAEEPLEEN